MGLGKCPSASDFSLLVGYEFFQETIRFEEIEQIILVPILHGRTTKSFLSDIMPYSNELINYFEFQDLKPMLEIAMGSHRLSD